MLSTLRFVMMALVIGAATPSFAAEPPAAAEPQVASEPHAAAKELMYQVSDAVVAGKTATAIGLLRKCVQVDKAYPQCPRVLGILYGKKGDEKRAAAAYRTYLKEAPKAQDATAVRELLREYEER